MVAFSDWWQSLIDRAEPKKEPAPAPSRSSKSGQTNMLAGSSVTKKTFHRGTSNTAAPANDYATKTRNLYREGLGMAGGQARTSRPAQAPQRVVKPSYATQTRNLYREGLGINPTPGKPREPGPDYAAQTRDLYREGLGLDRKPGREPQRNDKGEVWDRDDLAALDAKTRDRVDQEFAAEQRVEQLGMTNTLTPEEYAALSPRQQAAVQFNTGLIAAGRADAETGGVDATRDYLARFNITRDEKELSSFLRLDDLVSDSILRKLDDLTARHDSASSLRWARGDEKAAGDSARFLRARGSSDAAAEALAQLLTTTGNRSFGATDTRPGFGQGVRDEVIREAYAYMIDSRFNYAPQEIADNLQVMNQQAGTDVSTDELWEYLRANVDAVGYHRAGNNEATLPHPTESPYDKTPLTPLDVAEIRRRYGL